MRCVRDGRNADAWSEASVIWLACGPFQARAEVHARGRRRLDVPDGVLAYRRYDTNGLWQADCNVGTLVRDARPAASCHERTADGPEFLGLVACAWLSELLRSVRAHMDGVDIPCCLLAGNVDCGILTLAHFDAAERKVPV